MSFPQNWVVPPSSPRPRPLVYEDPDDESSRLPNNVLGFAAPPIIQATPPSPRPPQMEFSDDPCNYFDPPFQRSPKRPAEPHQESRRPKSPRKSRRWKEQEDLIHMAQYSGDSLRAPPHVDGYDPHPAAVPSAREKFRVYESPSFRERSKRENHGRGNQGIRRRNSLEVSEPVQPEEDPLQENKKPKRVSSVPIEHKKGPALRDLQMGEAKGKLTRLRDEVTNTTKQRRM